MDKIRPNFEEINNDTALGAILHCPTCGGHCVHHQQVEVYERAREDADYGVVVTINRSVTILTDQTKNPSPRRDGMRVWFWCEMCPATFSLEIIQHKGSTYLGMEIK